MIHTLAFALILAAQGTPSEAEQSLQEALGILGGLKSFRLEATASLTIPDPRLPLPTRVTYRLSVKRPNQMALVVTKAESGGLVVFDGSVMRAGPPFFALDLLSDGKGLTYYFSPLSLPRGADPDHPAIGGGPPGPLAMGESIHRVPAPADLNDLTGREIRLEWGLGLIHNEILGLLQSRKEKSSFNFGPGQKFTRVGIEPIDRTPCLHVKLESAPDPARPMRPGMEDFSASIEFWFETGKQPYIRRFRQSATYGGQTHPTADIALTRLQIDPEFSDNEFSIPKAATGLLDRQGWNPGERGPAIAPALVEAKLAELPNGGIVLPSDILVSPDGKRCASIVRGPERGARVLLDGKLHPEAEDIPFPGGMFGPGGKIFAYEILEKGRVSMVIEGKKGEPCDWVSPPAFSRDGSRIAYAGGRGGKAFVVIGDKKGPDHDDVHPVLRFQGQEPVYAAKDGTSWQVVTGKGRGESFDKIPTLTLSPDERHLAYAACLGGKWCVVVDGEKTEVPGQVRSLVFSPGGKRWACVANTPQEGNVLVSGKTSLPVDGWVISLHVPDEGESVDYSANDGRSTVVVCGGRKQEFSFELNRESFSWTPDGKSFAFGSGSFNQGFMVVRGEKGDVFERVGSPVWSGDGAHLAYPAQTKGKMRAVVDGAQGEPYDWVGGMTFAPHKGEPVYIAAAQGKERVVVGQRPGPLWDAVLSTPVASSDGKKVCYAVRSGREIRWKIVDLK